MKAVILAGGLGTRLSEETERIPKPMVEIGGRPILWHVMKIFGHYGINHFVICLGYKGYAIKEFFQNYFMHMSDVTLDIQNRGMEVHQNSAEPWRVTLIDTGLDTMTGGRLKRIRNYVQDGTFCMTYSDGLADIDVPKLLAFHQKHGKLATVTAIQPPGRFGVLEIADGRVSRFHEKAAGQHGSINGGFFVLEPAALDAIDGDHVSWEREPVERLARDGQLMAYQHSGFWQAMDTLRDKRLLEDVWSAGKAPWKTWT
jgi:glucose-1-phosphate cytidylyltransferase